MHTLQHKVVILGLNTGQRLFLLLLKLLNTTDPKIIFLQYAKGCIII